METNPVEVIQSRSRTDTPTEVGQYFGCTYAVGTQPESIAQRISTWRGDVLNKGLADLGQPSRDKSPSASPTVAYDVSDFGQCV